MKIVLALITTAIIALSNASMPLNASPAGERREQIRVKVDAGQDIWTACRRKTGRRVVRARPSGSGFAVCTLD